MILKVHVNKLQAAKRQLETAIELWFNEKDPLAIHTLAAAARQILVDLNKKRKGSPMGADCMATNPEEINALRKLVANTENFLKHADTDPEGELIFSSETTDLMILEAVYKCQELSGEQPSLFQLYIFHCAATHPSIFDEKFVQSMAKHPEINEAARVGKKKFLETFAPMFPSKP